MSLLSDDVCVALMCAFGIGVEVLPTDMCAWTLGVKVGECSGPSGGNTYSGKGLSESE